MKKTKKTEHFYFNEEWNTPHNISSLSTYDSITNNSFRYNRGDYLSDLYFFE